LFKGCCYPPRKVSSYQQASGAPRALNGPLTRSLCALLSTGGMDIDSTHRLGPSGHTLTVEERSGLQVAILERQKEENFPSKPLFWGKIFGELNDYLVVYALQTEYEFPIKKFYYW
jgi:hypothetical protein